MKAFKKIRDQAVVKRIKKGDSDALAEVYDEYNQKIYRYIYFKVSNKQVAEDLTGSTFLKLWEYFQSDNKVVENLSSFLYRIAHNNVIDYYRTRKELVEIQETHQVSEEVEDDLVDKVQSDQQLKELTAALRQMSDEYNDIVTLHYIEDYSIREIADILGKTENNVRVTLHRALKILRKKISNSKK